MGTKFLYAGGWTDGKQRDTRNLRAGFSNCFMKRPKYKYSVLLIKKLDAPILKFIFGIKILHVSDSSSIHHQEFFTVHTAMLYVIEVC